MTPVLRHIVLFWWKEGTTDEQVGRVAEGLGRMPELMPFIRRYDFADDAGLADGAADMSLVADFDSRDDWQTYRDHPEHRRVVAEAITPIVDRIERSQVYVGG